MKRALCVPLLFWSTIMAFPQNQPRPPQELVVLADAVMENRTDATEMRDAITAAFSAVEAEPDPVTRSVHVAHTLFLEGFWTLGLGNRAHAEALFTESLGAARQSLKERTTAEALRAESNALQQLMSIRGAGFQIVSAGTARRSALRAAELDPGNALAHLSAAAFLANAPAIGGGDPARALYHTREAERSTDGSRYERFLILVWSAVAHARRGEQSASRAAFASAWSIYPDNWWLADLEARISSDSPRR